MRRLNSFKDLTEEDFTQLALSWMRLDAILAEYDETASYTPEQLERFGAAFGQRFQLGGVSEDIERAIVILERAQRLKERYSPRWLSLSNTLSAALLSMYERSRDLAHLNRSIDLLGQLSEHLPSEPGCDLAHLIHLWSALNLRFERLEQTKDLDRLIRIGEEITASLCHDSPFRLLHLYNQQGALFRRYSRTLCLEDQKAAIEALYMLVKELPPTDPERAEHLQWLTESVMVYHYRSREVLSMHSLEEMQRALPILTLIVEELPAESPDRAMILEALLKMMVAIFNQTRNPSTVIEMAELGEKMLARISLDAPDLAGIVNFTGSVSIMRYSQCEDETYLEKAIQCLEYGIANCVPNPFYLRQCYYNLGNAFNLRYSVHQTLTDLDQAIASFEKAVELLEPGSRARRVYLYALSRALKKRFERTENMSDLQHSQELYATLRDEMPF